ncbi:hypothetical protein WG66_016108, partial [Moniliophthora roreri]
NKGDKQLRKDAYDSLRNRLPQNRGAYLQKDELPTQKLFNCLGRFVTTTSAASSSLHPPVTIFFSSFSICRGMINLILLMNFSSALIGASPSSMHSREGFKYPESSDKCRHKLEG